MPRKKTFTLVSINNGSLDWESFEDAEKLKAALAKLDDKADCVLFASQPVPFTINRTPTVVLGGATERKPRAKKGEGKPRKPKSTTVSGDFFEKPANGAVTTTPAPSAEQEG